MAISPAARLPRSPPAEHRSPHHHLREQSSSILAGELETVADMTQDTTDLVLLARRTVHTAYVEGMLTHCQCALCGRVERALREVAADADRARDGALADSVVATRYATLGLAKVARAVNERDAGDARDLALVVRWRALAALERSEASSTRSMSPDSRSVHNHRGQVYDACADQLAAQHRAFAPHAL